MVNTRVLGIIAAVLGIIGLASYGIDLQNLSVNSAISLIVLIAGLYFSLKDFL